MDKYTVKTLEDWDYDVVNQIVLMSREFIEEASYKLTFNSKKSYQKIFSSFMCDNSSILYLEDCEGEVAAGAFLFICADWHKEKLGYAEKFYVRKKYRGTKAGRTLSKACATWFDRNNCVDSFITDTAAVGQGRPFVNLMSKSGYKAMGPILIRENPNGQI